MKFLLIYTLLSLPLVPPPPAVQQGPGLEIVTLEAKEIDVDIRWRSAMVNGKPPVLKPDPGAHRGTDRHEPEIVTRQRETHQRTVELRQVSNKTLVKPVKDKAYDFRAEMKNNSSRRITGFVWAYRLRGSSPNQEDGADQEYICKVSIEPGEARRIKVVSPIPRLRVVHASAAGTAPAPQQPALQDMLINQVEYINGDTWQRPGWNKLILVSRANAQKVGKGKCVAL